MQNGVAHSGHFPPSSCSFWNLFSWSVRFNDGWRSLMVWGGEGSKHWRNEREGNGQTERGNGGGERERMNIMDGKQKCRLSRLEWRLWEGSRLYHWEQHHGGNSSNHSPVCPGVKLASVWKEDPREKLEMFISVKVLIKLLVRRQSHWMERLPPRVIQKRSRKASGSSVVNALNTPLYLAL